MSKCRAIIIKKQFEGVILTQIMSSLKYQTTCIEIGDIDKQNHESGFTVFVCLYVTHVCSVQDYINAAKLVQARLPNTPILIVYEPSINVESLNKFKKCIHNVSIICNSKLSHTTIKNYLISILIQQCTIIETQASIKHDEHVYIRGSSSQMRHMRSQIRSISSSSGNSICLESTPGGGSRVISKYIHQISPNKDGAYVTLHMHILSNLISSNHDTIIQSLVSRIINLSSNGTLVVFRSDLMSESMQYAILSVLKNNNPSTTDARVRIIFEMHVPINQLQHQKTFLRELFLIINHHIVTIPPLCDRISDIYQLCAYIARNISIKSGRNVSISDSALQLLQSTTWNHGLQQLIISIEYAVIHASSNNIISINDIIHLSQNSAAQQEFSIDTIVSMDFENARKEFDMIYLQKKIQVMNHNLKKTSESAGINRSTLYRKLKTLGLAQYIRNHDDS